MVDRIEKFYNFQKIFKKEEREKRDRQNMKSDQLWSLGLNILYSE